VLELPFALEPELPVEGRRQTNLCFLCPNQSATVLCSASISPEVFNTTSPECQGAGLQHREDVAVEAMDRAALLPLLQAIPRCSSPLLRRRVQSAR
jgi:hypothetical protein